MAACGWALRTGYSAAARSENSGSGGGTPALEVSLCTRYAWTGMATFGSARRATGLVASTRGPAESSGSTRLTASPRNTHLRWLWIHRSGSGRRPRQDCSWRSFPGKRFLRVEEVPPVRCWVVAAGPGGQILTGGAAGLFRLSEGRWRHISTADGLEHDMILAVATIKPDEIWVGYWF